MLGTLFIMSAQVPFFYFARDPSIFQNFNQCLGTSTTQILDNERPVAGNGIKYLPNHLLLGSKYAERQRVQTVQFPTEVARPPPHEDESSPSEEEQPAQVEDEVEDEFGWIPGDDSEVEEVDASAPDLFALGGRHEHPPPQEVIEGNIALGDCLEALSDLLQRPTFELPLGLNSQGHQNVRKKFTELRRELPLSQMTGAIRLSRYFQDERYCGDEGPPGGIAS
jgi:hypothetical protein